jgi:DNA-binding transcriptional MerR regulator
MLGVSPSTLRSWEQRYGHPSPRRSEGGHRLFELSEIEALREALARTGGEIAGAVQLARTQGRATGSPIALREAFSTFDAERADRLLEESLLVRSLERTVGELVLSTFSALDSDSPEQSFAWRYATGWLAAALRAAPPATREECILIFDCAGPGSLDALNVHALELFLRRRGLRALALSAALEQERVGRAVRAVSPIAVVLGGSAAELDRCARLIYAARQAAGQIEVFDFRGALPDTGASTIARLGEDALAASEALWSFANAPQAARVGARRGVG